MLFLVISTLLKIAVVIGILLGLAPVLVWLERRQSAMMQDRVGPVRSGIPLPPSVANLIQGPLSMGAKAVGYVCAGLAVIAGVVLVVLLGARWQLQNALVDAETRQSILDAVALLSGNTISGNADVPGTLDAAFSPLITAYGWGVVVLGLLSAFHFAASWFVKNMVDKRGHLTAFGLIHPANDVMKMMFKEDFIPPKADKLLHSLAPIIATIPAFATFAVIPFGPANLNVGILYIFAIAGTGIVGAAIAGYSSDNKYSLLGGIRAASQMVSYEVTLGLTLVGSFMVYGTLLLDEMVAWQQAHVWGFLVQPLGLILFFFSTQAEMKRVPFDAPEGESEIVAGYFLEYSGLKWGLFMTGEFVEHIASSALIVTLFFGGYDVPFLYSDGLRIDALGVYVAMPHILVVVLSFLAFVFKVLLCTMLQLQVRWTLPRFRYDQIMQLCWKIILPLSLANILVTGIVILLLQ